MTNYRRARVLGGTYFLTVALANRSSTALSDNIVHLRDAFAATRRERPFRCDAMVVLPDHLHAVWTLPAGDHDFSTRWRLIKARFTRSVMGAEHPSHSSKSLLEKRGRGLWQRRFWERLIRDEGDYETHIHYCWANPVKHGHAATPCDWPYSSIHRDMRLGLVSPGWSAP